MNSSHSNMKLKYSVIVQTSVEGLHNWPLASTIFPEVGFLSDIHRHIFHIKACLPVTHTDRDVEFIMFKRELTEYLNETYYSEVRKCLFFGPESCEMIATKILQKFNCTWVEVFEDAENGARVEIDNE